MKIDSAINALHTLQEFFRNLTPVWTTDMPTREGYYWMRGSKRDEVTVVKVRIDHSEPTLPFVVQAGHPADTGVQYLRDYRGCQWAGPIDPPREP